MNDITIITPSVRPQNLSKVYDSINLACRNFNDKPLWIVTLYCNIQVDSFDEARNVRLLSYFDDESVKGSAGRNKALDLVKSKYVTFLDDDNLMHPDFFNTVVPVLNETGKSVVVSQNRGNGVYLWASPENMRPCNVDIGQVVLKMETIGTERFEHNGMHDGILYEKLYKKHPEDFVFIQNACSFFNAL